MTIRHSFLAIEDDFNLILEWFESLPIPAVRSDRSQFELGFSRTNRIDNWNYYLEESIRNYAEELYALPKAFAALNREQYFVHPDDTPSVLDKLCRALRLRGVACSQES